MDAASASRSAAIAKIVKMPADQVMKVLIFMAGMEAGEAVKDAGPMKKTEVR